MLGRYIYDSDTMMEATGAKDANNESANDCGGHYARCRFGHYAIGEVASRRPFPANSLSHPA